MNDAFETTVRGEVALQRWLKEHPDTRIIGIEREVNGSLWAIRITHA